MSSCDLDDYVTTVTTMSSARSEESVSSCDLDDYVTTVTTMSSARSEEDVSRWCLLLHIIYQAAFVRGCHMNPISEKLGLQPDILEGATIVKMFGTEYAIIENYKSLIEYTECLVKVQGKHMRVVIEGEKLGIESFQPDECRVCGKIEKIYFAS